MTTAGFTYEIDAPTHRPKKRQLVSEDLSEVFSQNAAPDEQTLACLKLWVAKFRLHVSDAKTAIRLPSWFNTVDLEPGSFMWCCDLFDFDPVIVLKRLSK